MHADSLMDTTELHSAIITVRVLGTNIRVHVKIFASWLTTLDFNFQGCPYTFIIDRWRSRNFGGFLRLFFAHGDRDEHQFGALIDDGAGNTRAEMDITQKKATVMQAVRDVLTCLAQIAETYQRSIVDYALWYRERRVDEEMTYKQFITRVTCNQIVHTDFMAPAGLAWELVEFA